MKHCHRDDMFRFGQVIKLIENKVVEYDKNLIEVSSLAFSFIGSISLYRL